MKARCSNTPLSQAFGVAAHTVIAEGLWRESWVLRFEAVKIYLVEPWPADIASVAIF
jgi:hypothetical protein